MAIIYNEKERTISLHTKNTTYQMLIGKYQYLLHLYYGKKIQGSMEHLLTYADRGFSGNPYDAENDRTFSLDVLPQEYSCMGNGDYRNVSFWVNQEDGTSGCDLRYISHEVCKGKYKLPGLPAVYAKESEGETLKVKMQDTTGQIQVTLLYGVLEAEDIITRAVIVENIGQKEIRLEKAHSGALDYLTGDYDLLHFYGRHGMERIAEKTPVTHGVWRIGSRRGTSSHQHNPFVILAAKDTTEEWGPCYGMSLMYSGNFSAEAGKDQFNQTRLSMGINEELFSYRLKTGETFTTPEIILSYSDKGLGALSRNYHRVIRNHVCRGKYKKEKRPVLINNWEATYFDFTGEKIHEIARQAAQLGVEMFVLDDGWFGKRDSDDSGLGDWQVNEAKLGESMGELAEKINDLGMKFGLWIEPEMVSEDSDLYRAHPDWAFALPGKKPIRGRNQLVLDFSRKEIVDHIFAQIANVIDEANIEYIKMDMNRSICDVFSATCGAKNQGEVMHHYVLGVYDFLERLNTRYPDMLIEGCSGGGGRFDAGMLYYTPQIWCSDNTDAIERLTIQYGTSFGYPVSTMGAHVSAVPNEQTGRTTNIKTRACVAMSGSFGYELDINRITEEEKAAVREQIQEFHQYWDLVHNGDYYRITNPIEDKEIAAWLYVADDQSEALMNVVTLSTHCNAPVSYIRFVGLKEETLYEVNWSGAVNGQKIYGSALMNVGFPVPMIPDEYQSWKVYVKQVEA